MLDNYSRDTVRIMLGGVDPIAILARISCIVFASELLVMLCLASWQLDIGAIAAGLIDASVLTIVSALAIIVWVVDPFVAQVRNTEQRLEQGLESATAQAKELVATLARLDLHKKILDQHAIVCECDAEGKISYVNDALCRISGYSRDELIGKPKQFMYTDILPEALWDEAKDPARGCRVWQSDVCQRAKDGTHFWLAQSIAAMRNESGDVTGFVSVATNITEHRALREEIERKGKLAQLGELTATMAHEIRNPLGAVKTATFVLERKIKAASARLKSCSATQDCLTAKELKALPDNGAGSSSRTDCGSKLFDFDSQLQRINSGIARCDKIITELLDFTRTRTVATKQIEVDSWVREIVEEETKMLPGKVQITCDLGLGDAVAVFDPDQMRRVVINLLSNASEAMVGKGGEAKAYTGDAPFIEITTRLSGDVVELNVKDNGPGIAAENVKKIREPLFTTKSFGIGLGIPAVEKILESHGGSLVIESVPGKGASITARFLREMAATLPQALAVSA